MFMLNEFSRTELLIGRENVKRLRTKKVAVFGIGGVGSFVIEGLVRSGVSNFVVVDNDNISITNINRQIHADHTTLGMAKVDVIEKRIKNINPEAIVEKYKVFYLPELRNELIRTDYDYIIDAVDTITAKIDLIVSARDKNIPIISSMGTGNKIDPTKFKITDIYKTYICPLAKVMRKELKKRNISKLKVLYSNEIPLKPKFEYDLEDNQIRKKQVTGSISFVPPVAGLIIAGEVINDLIK